jgi:hypothetical protein
MYAKPCLQCDLSTVLTSSNIKFENSIHISVGQKIVVSCKGNIRSPVLINTKIGSYIQLA